MNINEIKKLNPKEKIKLINQIWDSFEDIDNEIDSPNWHKKVLEDRVKKINSNKIKYISIEELRNI